MKTRPAFLRLHGFLGIICLVCLLGRADETMPMDSTLEVFRPFLGKTWRGEFKESTPEKPVVDISRWERVLNGKAIRILHTVNDGAYGGESIVRWDPAQKSVVYNYFTTAGFSTTGTMKFVEGRIVATEKVSGEASGITEVQSTTELRKDGTMLTKAEYLKDGKISGGREVIYKPAPDSELKWK